MQADIGLEVIPAEQNTTQGKKEVVFPQDYPADDAQNIAEQQPGVEQAHEGQRPENSRAYVWGQISEEVSKNE